MNIARACRTLGVSRSGYHGWVRARTRPCQRRRRDAELAAIIREVHRQSRGTYGAPRVHAELRLGLDIRVGRKRVERLMRVEGLQGITRRRPRGLTRRDATAVPNDDLVARQFSPNGPNELWVADITEHPTREGRVYLAVVIDAWNRQVVGHSISDHLRADALDMACWRRRPDAGQTVHHSDRGVQIHVMGVRAAAPHCGPVGLHGHRRRRPGQRRGRELLRNPANRAPRPASMGLETPASAGDLRTDRDTSPTEGVKRQLRSRLPGRLGWRCRRRRR
jgi:transposase InsO family protein